MPLNTRQFLLAVAEEVRERLPQELRGFQMRGPAGALVKLHYGRPRIHYEVWLQRRQGRVEIGLHFEDEPQLNGRMLEAVSLRFLQVQGALPFPVEPEQWTASWTRVHTGLPLQPLEELFLKEVARRTAALIAVLEPLVRDTL